MDSGGLKRARLAAGGISEETMVRIANEEGKRADAGTEATSLAITPKHIRTLVGPLLMVAAELVSTRAGLACSCMPC